MSFAFQLEGIFSNLIAGTAVLLVFYKCVIEMSIFIPPIFLFIGGIMPLKMKKAIVRELKRVFKKDQLIEESLPHRLQEYTPLINH